MKTVTLPLDKLIPYAGNPRKNDHAVEAVASAIKRFGFRVPVLAKSDGSLIDGHLRVKAAKHLGMKEVPVVLCDDLSEADIKALRISINRMAELAEWDTELLSAELEGLAAEGFELDDVGFDLDSLSALDCEIGPSDNDENDGIDDTYTRKIIPPVYEPKGDCPPIVDLCDKEKMNELIKEIQSTQINEQVAEFLIEAAHRHTGFHFARIAEFYCHQSPEVQHLMERSGLVIIDINKAIENGFVHLTERLGKLADLEEAAGTDQDNA